MVRKLSIIFCLVFLFMACTLVPKNKTLPTQTLSTQPNSTQPVPPTPGLITGPSEEVKNEQGGYSLEIIPDFDVLRKGGLMTLTAPGVNPAFGPQVVLFGGTVPKGTTLQSLIDLFRQTPDMVLSKPVEAKVAGKPALAAQVTIKVGNRTVLGRLVVVLVSSQQQFLLLAGAVDGVWQNSFAQQVDALCSSLKLFPTKPPSSPAPPSLIRQWAVSAKASSEQSNSAGAASQATGFPQIFPCGENPAAWSPASQNREEWIELTYAVPVQPISVTIYESSSPISLLKIEAVDQAGGSHLFCNRKVVGFELYCTAALDCKAENAASYRTGKIRISMDLSAINKPAAFDAVELVGYSEQGPPIPAEMTILPGQAPQGFLWRVGYDFRGFSNRLKNPDGMDVDAQGRLYVNQGGIVDIFDRDGNWLTNFDYVGAPTTGLKVAPDGRIVMADWGANQVMILSPDGSVEARAGGPGSDPGQFAQFYPKTFAIHPTSGEIYAPTLKDPSTLSYSVNVFTLEGSFIRSFSINDSMKGSDSSYSPEKLAFGPDGFLYAVDSGKDYVLKLDTSGNVLAHLGEESLSNCTAWDIAVDRTSNIYIGCQTGAGVMKISPQGKLLAEWGFLTQGIETQVSQTFKLTTNCSQGSSTCWQEYYLDPPTATFLPEGGISSLTSLAIQPDGSQVYLSEWGPNSLSSITSFEVK